MNTCCQSPVLFLVFNRPDVTKEVFEAIRRARPQKLFVAADGPRLNREGESEQCQLVRRIATDVDWECEVKTLLRDENIGCGQAVSGAITWFFQNVREGIILEDDCLPCPSFFTYCDVMLERYRNDPRIASVSGCNVFDTEGEAAVTGNYFLSRYPLMWGWATWRRAWENYAYDVDPLPLSFYKKKNLGGYFLKDRFSGFLERIRSGELDTWDFQWMVAVWRMSGLTVTPSVNLIQNIGFGNDATHTKSNDSDNILSKEAHNTEVSWGLVTNLRVNENFDRKVVRYWLNATFSGFLRRRISKLFPS